MGRSCGDGGVTAWHPDAVTYLPQPMRHQPPRSPRRKLNVALIVLVVVGVVLILCLAGIGGLAWVGSHSTPAANRGASGATGEPVAASQPEPIASRTLSPEEWASIEASQGFPPKPDPKTTAAYIAGLKAINVAIVGKHSNDVMVSRGRDQCQSVHLYPNDRAKLLDLTNRRFTAPDAPDGFGLAAAGKILDVVHKNLCPSFPIATR
jgi:hypothetical protein